MFRKISTLALLPFALCLFTFKIFAQQTGVDVLKMMHERHGNGKWPQTLTFEQKTRFFKNDVQTDTAIWFEAIKQPNNLRIDFDSLTSGHSAIWTRDSAFIFKKGALAKSYSDENDLLFILGGWHFFSTEEVVKKLAEFKFDATQPTREAGFKSKTCWVVGDIKKGGNEVWIEQKRLLPMRILTQTKGSNDEIWCENYVRLPRGWCEGKVTFFKDGQKVQEEIYNEIAADRELAPDVFDPKKYAPRVK